MMLGQSWPQAMANAETVIAAAEIPAAPELVFTALVTTEVKRWWGSPETYRMTGWSADLRAVTRQSGRDRPRLGSEHGQAGRR